MVIGTQHLSGDDWPQYQALAQLGVRHVSANPPGDWRTWTAPVLSEFKARLAELDQICELIRNLSLAGIHAARYNAAFLGHFRTPDRLGRGGARLSSFVYDQL